MKFNPETFGLNVMQEYQSGLNFFGHLGGGTSVTQFTPQLERYIRQEIRYLKNNFKIKRFRFAMPDYSWQARLDYHRLMLEIFANEGNLHLEYGIGPTGINGPTWGDYLSKIDGHVLWFRDLINSYAYKGVTGVWYTGNELEGSAGGYVLTATSVVRVSNVVTVTFAEKHYSAAGETFTIYNTFIDGFRTVASVVDDYTITFNLTGSNNSQTGGDFVMSADTMRKRQKRMVTHFVTDLGINDLDFAYSCLQGYEAANLYFYTRGWKEPGTFPQIGKSPFRYIDLNTYGQSNSNPETNWNRWKAQVDALVSELGVGNCRVTEWNMQENDNTISANANNNLWLRINFLKRRLQYLDYLGVPHYFFAWRMPPYLGERFPTYSTIGGGIRPSFYALTGRMKERRYKEIVPK